MIHRKNSSGESVVKKLPRTRIQLPDSLWDKERTRFFALVHPEPNTGCWLWSGGNDVDGYGKFASKIAGMWVHYKATHVSLIFAGRPLRGDLIVCHRCDFPPCVNPDHLFAGTHKDNVSDCQKKGRAVAPPRYTGRKDIRPFCRNGHAMVLGNIYWQPSGYPECRECQRTVNERRPVRL